MSCDLRLLSDNNNVVELPELKNKATGIVDTGATVTCSLYDPLGALVSGQSWPIAMAHVGAGKYRATLPPFSLKIGRTYRVVVHSVGSGGEVGHWDEDIIAERRSS